MDLPDRDFRGIVVPGRGFGAQRMTNPAVLHAVQRLTALTLVPGTLNIRLPQPFDGLLPWVPALNLALPGEGDPKEMQAVLDARPLTEVNGVRRHHRKPELWWRNALQIGRLSKKRKDRVTSERQTHRGVQRV